MASAGWPGGARVAVSLTYDGALAEHLDVVLPALSQHRLRATFFLTPSRVLENVQAWQSLAAEGHEVGNGCLLGVSDEGRLHNWTLRMVEQDVHMTQEFLTGTLDCDVRTFAYPGRKHRCAQGDYRRIVEQEFEFARSAHVGDNSLDSSVKYLRCRDLSAHSVPELDILRRGLLAELDDPDLTPVWHILRFGKMFDGETNRLLLLHELCLTLLRSQSDAIWVAPVAEVAMHVSQLRGIPAVL